MGKRTNLYRALVCALLLITSTAHAQDTAQSDTGRQVRNVARVILSDDIGGRFAEPECSDGVLVRAHDTSAFTGVFMARGSGADAPLVVDAGGLLTPHGVARFAARDLPEALVRLVVDLGYDALAFGSHDLGAPRARMVHLAQLLGDAHVPYVASNLGCEGVADALCDTIVDAEDPPFHIQVGAEDTAFLAFLDPSVLHRVAPDRSEGITVTPIPIALPAMVREAHLAGATLVVAVLDVSSDQALTIARRLPPDARPDILLLAGEGDQLLFARPATVVPPIVSAPPGSGVEVLVGQSDELRHGFEMLARPLELEGSTPAPPVTAFVEAVGPAYCAAWGRALPGGHLSHEIGPTEIAELAARIVREHAHADVSFLNIAAIDQTFVAASPSQLSASDFYIALSYDEPIVVADVNADWLAEAQARLASHRMVAPGLGTDDSDDAIATGAEDAESDADDDDDDDDDDPSLGSDPGEDTEAASEADDTADESAMRVRGRPAVSGPGASYRVATIRFLAEGGDGALPHLPEGSEWHTLGQTLPDGTFHYDSLRDVVIAALEPEDPRDPRDARPSPNDAPEWVVRGSLDGNFAGSSVSNPMNMYEAALLSTENTISLGVVGDLRVDATAPDWTWENRLLARYRTQWTPSEAAGESGKFVEASDQIQLRSLLSYRGWRPHTSDWYIPDAYGEVFIESEFTQPDPAPGVRDWHWFLVRPTVGFRFPLATVLSVNLQTGFQTQVFAPDGAPEFGLGASAQLRQWKILDAGERSLTADGFIDFFDLVDQSHYQIRGQLDLALDLAGPLALTLGTTLYLEQANGLALGTAITATAGLRLQAVTRVVGP